MFYHKIAKFSHLLPSTSRNSWVPKFFCVKHVNYLWTTEYLERIRPCHYYYLIVDKKHKSSATALEITMNLLLNFPHSTIKTDPDLWVCMNFFLVSDTAPIRQLKQRRLQKYSRICHFLAIFWILTAWTQLMRLHLNSTKFRGNFETTYKSGTV